MQASTLSWATVATVPPGPPAASRRPPQAAPTAAWTFVTHELPAWVCGWARVAAVGTPGYAGLWVVSSGMGRSAVCRQCLSASTASPGLGHHRTVLRPGVTLGPAMQAVGQGSRCPLIKLSRLRAMVGASVSMLLDPQKARCAILSPARWTTTHQSTVSVSLVVNGAVAVPHVGEA